MERIALIEAETKRRRGLEEVAVVLSHGDRSLRGTGRVSRRVDRSGAAVEATLTALGPLAEGFTLAGAEQITAGPVRVLQVTLDGGGAVWEGSCSMADRSDAEAGARAALDALNPYWDA